MNVPSPEKITATWNSNTRYHSTQQTVATPNHNGSTWEVTNQTNGTCTWPTLNRSAGQPATAGASPRGTSTANRSVGVRTNSHPVQEERAMNDEVTVPRKSRRRLRVGLVFASIVTAVAALAAGAVTLTSSANAASAICSNQTGGSQGGYYQMWTAGQGTACMDLASSGMNYSTSWSGIGDFVAGAGWKPGSTSRKINYNASLNASGGTALLTLYGWTTNPLIEFYVIENYVGSAPTSGQNMGTVTSDGGTYTIIKHQQVNQPSIQGTTTFWQYIAIRQSKRSSGTITFSNFVNAWASKGMNLGSMYYQIMATEAWGGGSGSSQVSYS
jgi:endo-1,4-beta-xylanase